MSSIAVSYESGVCAFGVEPTGRYGGINIKHDKTIKIQTVSIEEILIQVLEKHGIIDILKIDIESYELEILNSISERSLEKIRCISVEFPGELEFVHKNFSIKKIGTIYTMKNKSIFV